MTRVDRYMRVGPMALTATVAILAGIAVGVAPWFSVLLFVALGAAAFVAFVPLAYFPAVVLAAQAMVAATRHDPTLSRAEEVIGGPARLVFLMLLAMLLRLAAHRSTRRLPGDVVVAVFLALLVLSWQGAMTAINGPDESLVLLPFYGKEETGTLSALVRDMLLPLTAFVGALAVADDQERRRAFRGIAVVVSAICASSALYWAHVATGLDVPILGTYFAQAYQETGFGERSIFPFTQVSPNGNAVTFVLLGLIAVPLWFTRHRSDRVFALTVSLLVPLAVLSTESRTGVLCLMAGSAAALATTIERRHLHRVIPAGVVGAVVMAAVAVSLPDDRQISSDASTLVARAELWDRAWSTAQEAPVVGLGYAVSLGPRFDSPPIPGTRPAYATAQGPPVIAGTQSEYLGQVVDGGLVGGLLFLGVFALFVRRGLRLRGEGAHRAVGGLLIGAVAASAVAAFSTQLTAHPSWAIALWMAFGLAGSAGVEQRRVRKRGSRVVGQGAGSGSVPLMTPARER